METCFMFVVLFISSTLVHCALGFNVDYALWTGLFTGFIGALVGLAVRAKMEG